VVAVSVGEVRAGGLAEEVEGALAEMRKDKEGRREERGGEVRFR